MPLFNANQMIKEMRKIKGLTQEKLAEGICSRSTINMIEQGKRKPDWYTFKSLMDRLGVDVGNYFSDTASENEAELYSLLYSLRRLRTLDKFDELKTEIEKMNTNEKFKEGLGYRVYRECCGFFYSAGPYADLPLALKYTMEILEETRPGFDVEEMQNYFLSDNERAAVGRLINIYGETGETEKAIRLRYKLIENYEKNNTPMGLLVRGNYCTQIANLAYRLNEAGRYEECLEATEKGMKTAANDIATTEVYMRILYFKACALLFLNQKEEGNALYKRYIHYAHAMGENQSPDFSVEFLKKNYEKSFGGKLELFLPW